MENVALAQSSPCQAQTLSWAENWNLELPLSVLLGVWSLLLVSKEVQHSVPLVPHLFMLSSFLSAPPSPLRAHSEPPNQGWWWKLVLIPGVLL